VTITTLVLVVSPSLKPDGGKAYSTRGQLFDSKVDGRPIVKRSTTPFCAAARALLAEGVNPATTFVMRDERSPSYDALRSTVGVAAGLTVADDKGGRSFPDGRRTMPAPVLWARRLCEKQGFRYPTP
jgi:hypothetical protein